MGFSDFMFGGASSTWGDRKEELYNRLASTDNREADFNRYAGQALNNLAGRGVINSSVGSSALANAAAQAQRNYDDQQMQLLSFLASQQDEDYGDGLMPGLLGIAGTGIGAFLGGAEGAAIGATLGSGIGSSFSRVVR